MGRTRRGEPGVIGGEPDARGEDERQFDAAICLAPDGDIALECKDGFRYVENCVSPCEQLNGEAVCAAICPIEYECQAL